MGSLFPHEAAKGMITPRRVLYVAGGALLVSVIAVFALPGEPPVPEVMLPGQVTLPEGSPTLTSLNPDVLNAADAASPTSTVPAAAAVVIPKRPYGAVVAEFDQGGRRTQVSLSAQGTCRVIPSRFALARTSLLMLDNRSDRSITIVLDGRSYPLPAYQYHIAQMRFSRGPGEYPIHCGSQFNAGTVMVQP